ncbi:conserved hypothetical protein [Candidatus Zixiibacteriota bacterium]|nr:conserved hypothetical protein [candidate division Zixibacteria bacterium]
MKGRIHFLAGIPGRYISLALVAVVFTVLGIILASNLDLSQKSIATPTTAASPTFPVVQTTEGELHSPFVPVVEKVKDAVVNIAAEVPQQYGSNDFFYHFFGMPQGPAYSYGSGFFFRADGYILTNNHVVSGASKVMVRTSTGYQYEAQVVGADPQTDLAVLKVKPEEKITYISFGNSDEIKVGDWAIAIGNPFPQQGLDRTVTVGVISAKGRTNLNFGNESPRYQDYIQTDASINPGNSGGPLLDLKGEAIGVNAAISTPSGGSVGIGFAVPINLARAIVPDLIATGHISTGWLGIYMFDVSQAQAKQLGLEAVRGVYIDSVFAGSPADQAGIKKGDVLTKFNGQDVSDGGQLMALIATAPKDKSSTVDLIRDGKHITVTPTVVDMETYAKAHESQFRRATPASMDWLGMQLLTFTPDIANQIGIDYLPGVLVNRVARNSRADQANIHPGSIITSIDNVEIKNLDDLKLEMQSLKGRKSAIPFLVVDPSGSIEYKAIRP